MDDIIPQACTLCPRRCKADRRIRQGRCGAGNSLCVARAALHLWEEPCISGTDPARGSGTVFFSGCPLGCVFCQNGQISHRGEGVDITPEHLAGIFLRLQQEGAYNINLVTPTQYVPWILKALKLCENKLKIPVLYNSGGYETVETLRLLEGKVSIYLPDLKYYDSALSARYSGAEDYFEFASTAIPEMFRQTGPVSFNEEGILQKGMIIRHLVLPGCFKDSIRLLHWIADHFVPEDIRLSLMSQYTPPVGLLYKEISRPVFSYEYHKVCDEAAELGFLGYTQERSSANQCYTPAFDGTGV